MKALVFLFFLLPFGVGSLAQPVSASSKMGLCRTIYDFESESELTGLVYQCHTWFELSGFHATSGKKSLRLEMYPPAEYPGLRLRDLKGPWLGVRYIKMDVYNPASTPLQMTIRIDDRPGCPPYEDRINKPVTLKPGPNSVTVDLAKVHTSGSNRLLDPENIRAFMMFLSHPQRPATIFVDNIRVCKGK